MIVKRKVLRVGNSSLAVSLPSKWVKDHHLSPGTEIEFSEDGKLELQPAVIDRSYALSLDELSYYQLLRHVSLLYREGYDCIQLLYTKKSMLHDKENKMYPVKTLLQTLIRRFIGAELVYQTDKGVELEFFVPTEEKDIDRIEKRLHFLFKELLQEILNARDYAVFHEGIDEWHDTLTRLINFYLRSTRKQPMLYALYISLDDTLDQIRYISEAIHNYGCTPRVRKYLDAVFTFFSDAYFMIFSGKFDGTLVKRRYELINSIDNSSFTAVELRVIERARVLLNTLNNFSEAAAVRQLRHF